MYSFCCMYLTDINNVIIKKSHLDKVSNNYINDIIEIVSACLNSHFTNKYVYYFNFYESFEL